MTIIMRGLFVRDNASPYAASSALLHGSRSIQDLQNSYKYKLRLLNCKTRSQANVSLSLF